jgi:crotonobetainyl-CoA:carnitine CoA-transferase CaiB-like acyl-CoA transferase
MVRLVSDSIRRKRAAEWLEQLEAAGIPAGPINTINQALSDVQAQHRRMVRTLAGVPVVGSPVRLDRCRADSDLPPPALGEHTEDVLGALGLASEEVERLRTAGVIG